MILVAKHFPMLKMEQTVNLFPKKPIPQKNSFCILEDVHSHGLLQIILKSLIK